MIVIKHQEINEISVLKNTLVDTVLKFGLVSFFNGI